jgi:hypothetical protein
MMARLSLCCTGGQLSIGNTGHGNQCNPDGVIVRPPQKNIRGNRAFVEYVQEMFHRRFDQFAVKDQVERLIFDGIFPMLAYYPPWLK